MAKRGGLFPDQMVGKNIESLDDGVNDKTAQHQPRCVGEDRGDSGGSPVAVTGGIEEPGLRNENEYGGGTDADNDGFVRVFFALGLT